MAVSEDQLDGWTLPSSDSEQDKQERTVRMIKQAIDAHDAFDGSSFSVYAKGSYPNNTNVRLDSDVDVAVQCHEAFFFDPSGATQGGYDGKWTASFLRNKVTEALTNKFGPEVVSGNTAIQVNASGSRVDADVVPCFDYRFYFKDGNYQEGISVIRKNGSRVPNYPQQHLDNGRRKNNATYRRYKWMVRILKRVSGGMESEGIHRSVPSYLVESLAYNCPDQHFVEYGTWRERLAQVLPHIARYTDAPEPNFDNERWTEADGCKFLFHPAQKWTREDADDFVNAAWRYIFD